MGSPGYWLWWPVPHSAALIAHSSHSQRLAFKLTASFHLITKVFFLDNSVLLKFNKIIVVLSLAIIHIKVGIQIFPSLLNLPRWLTALVSQNQWPRPLTPWLCKISPLIGRQSPKLAPHWLTGDDPGHITLQVSRGIKSFSQGPFFWIQNVRSWRRLTGSLCPCLGMSCWSWAIVSRLQTRVTSSSESLDQCQAPISRPYQISLVDCSTAM